jgi:hypothetical protein
MLNSRSIPPELWEQARQALVFYFLRRHGFSNAEDLAHDTLQAVWIREDFTFAEEGQFLRVCYGFASRISMEGRRKTLKQAASELGSCAPAPDGRVAGMAEAEARVFLGEVRRTAKTNLSAEDWELVSLLLEGERPQPAGRFRNPNQFRVHLHRMRRKLADLTGWRGRSSRV